ncbi:MAG: aminopeptidase [Clostridia bacterium]|nr:aminopeptidase [Clostridia bacterium]
MSENKFEDLIYKKKTVFERESEEEISKMKEYGARYMKWLDKSKTEREASRNIIAALREAGFEEYDPKKTLRTGDRFFINNRGKNVMAAVVGSGDIEEIGIRISASHIDSPRLDLKPLPVFESDGVGYFKTHYYGGVRKYQWPTIPLSLHGVVVKKDGSTVDIVVGEDEGDPVFCISDLLPHLAGEQGTKPLNKAFTGEGLNIMICSSPALDEGKPVENDAVKINILSILKEKYGITEEDFLSADLCAVPATKAADVGFDRWLIGAYGHDDRVCAYPMLTALLDNAASPNHTLIAIFADKEEVGSDGPTGMKGKLFSDLVDKISRDLGADPAVVRAHSACLSADVAAAYDPNYPEAFEKRNSAILHCGVGFCKYTGHGGKVSTNDAGAEFSAKMRSLLDRAGVVWQMAELGKVDQGGGGTVAMFISTLNIDTIDIGVPVIAMHSPFEIISKGDLYEAHKAFSAFNAE